MKNTIMKLTLTLTVVGVTTVAIITQFSPEPNIETMSIQKPVSYSSESKLDKILSQLQANNSSIEAIRLSVSMNKEGLDRLNRDIGEMQSMGNLPKLEFSEAPEVRAHHAEQEFANATQLDEEAFENEEVDLAWANQSESNLDLALGELREKLNFNFTSSSSCRSTRCKAVVIFDSYELAREHGMQLAGVSLSGLNCAQSINLPEPSDTSAKYEADLHLDCTEQVKGLDQEH